MARAVTISATLTALAEIDSGRLRVRVDEGIYSQAALREVSSSTPARVTTERAGADLWLLVEATSPAVARLEIGNLLVDLLRLTLHERS